MTAPSEIRKVEYSVCGYSKKHGYYRTKRGSFNTEEEALEQLKVLREDPEWRISTIVVEETFLKKEHESLTADMQRKIYSCPCKNNFSKIYKTNEIGNFTY